MTRRTWSGRGGGLAVCAIAASLLLGGTASADLSRSLNDYIIFALKRAQIKNFKVLNNCNIGVNCDSPSANSTCGRLTGDPQFLDGGQLAADRTFHPKPGCVINELYRDGGGSLSECVIKSPPVHTFDPPPGEDLAPPGPGEADRILPDIDGDGIASCDDSCNVDLDDIKQACGFPEPFPPCDLTKPVQVRKGKDCIGVADSDPGNGQCDLAPGTYGLIVVKNLGTLELDGGTYNVCGFRAGKVTVVTSVTPSVINIAAPGILRIGDGSLFGQECGDIAINIDGSGPSQFGRNAKITTTVCAPEAQCGLGHANDLKGRFVCDVVSSDANNTGECCGGRCACFDEFDPKCGAVGDTITLKSDCSFLGVSGVKVCGINASFTVVSSDTLTFTVPAGASGDCPITVESAAGTFTHGEKLSVPAGPCP